MSLVRSLLALALATNIVLPGCVGSTDDVAVDAPLLLAQLNKGTGVNGTDPDCVSSRLAEILEAAHSYPISVPPTTALNPGWTDLGYAECLMENVAWAGLASSSTVTLPIIDPSTGSPVTVTGTGMFAIDLAQSPLAPPTVGALGDQTFYDACFLELLAEKWNKNDNKVPVMAVSPCVQQNAPQAYLETFQILEMVMGIEFVDGVTYSLFVNTPEFEGCPGSWYWFQKRLCHDTAGKCHVNLYKADEYNDFCTGTYGDGNPANRCFGNPVLESWVQKETIATICGY